MSDRPATEPRTEAGRRLAEADAQALWSPAEVRAAILAIEAEAAESRPSVTEALRIPQSSPDYATRYGRGWNDALAAVDRAASPAGPEAVPQSEREGLPNRDLLAEAIFESGVRQTMSQSEMAADNILAEMSILLARLASPAHPDEEPR